MNDIEFGGSLTPELGRCCSRTTGLLESLRGDCCITCLLAVGPVWQSINGALRENLTV